MKARWTIPALIVGLLVGAASTWWLMKPPKIRNGVTVVLPNVLYRSGQLEPQQLAQEIDRRRFKTVINLGSGKDWDQNVCQAKGVRYISIPNGDVWQMEGLPDPEAGGKVLPQPDNSIVWKTIEDPGSQPVLIHCWGGTHRTGVTVAKYRILHQGWDPQDAIDEMKLYGFPNDDSKFANVLEHLRSLRSKDRAISHKSE